MTTANTQSREQLEVIHVTPTLVFPRLLLSQALPDVETALFFAKMYKLNTSELSVLFQELFNSDVVRALTGEAHVHSTDLQDYLVEVGYEYLIDSGEIVMDAERPHGEVLPEMWASLELEVADSIVAVAEKLQDVVAAMPGKQGAMVFKSMMTMNAKRPVLGNFKAMIKHKRQGQNLVILDVSGSMSRATVSTIIDDVVALSWAADAHLAIVSNTTTVWAPGSFDSNAVLAASEFSGTHYETLAQLFEKDWGVVVCIADYDSSPSAKDVLRATPGDIELVLDISLVDMPTYLAECVGTRAKEVRPLLIAARHTTLTR